MPSKYTATSDVRYGENMRYGITCASWRAFLIDMFSAAILAPEKNIDTARERIWPISCTFIVSSVRVQFGLRLV